MNNSNYDNSCTISQSHIVKISEANYDCFQHLTNKEKKLFEDNLVEVNFKKGETIAKQGSFASSVIFLTKGLVKVYIENGIESLILKIVPENNLIGLPALFEDKKVFPYSAVTYLESSAKLIDIKIFEDIVKGNQKFSYQIMKTISSNAVQIYGRFFCFEKKQSYGRLADILLCLSVYIFKKNKFDLSLSRKEIGELAGMSYESVIRIMKKFKEDKLIEEKNNHISILDFDKLRNISRQG